MNFSEGKFPLESYNEPMRENYSTFPDSRKYQDSGSYLEETDLRRYMIIGRSGKKSQ